MEIHTQNDDIAGSNSHSVPVSSDAWSELPEDLRREAEGVSKSRRDFMKVTGMAAMGAVIAGCTAEDRIVKPLTQKPEGITPGVAYNYASTCQGCSANCGILMKVRDGRPVKLEGNDTNPLNAKTLGGPDKNKGKRPDNGGLCAVGQAQMWTLYNPERLHNPTNKGEAAKWEDIDAAAKAAIGNGSVLLTGTVSGPSAKAVIAKFKAKGGRHVSYDAISRYSIAKAHEATHTVKAIPHYKFAEAAFVLSLDADFLGTWLSPVEHARDWASQRDLKWGRDTMSRLVAIEARVSLTGANADERFRVKDSARAAVLTDLANRLGGSFGAAGEHGIEEGDMAKLASELERNGRRALVVSGSRDVEEQKLVNWINDKLGAYGATIDLSTPSQQKLGNDEDLAKLLKDMEAGSVKSLVVWGCNPVYDLPDGGKFKEALSKIENSFAISTYADETASECAWIAAADDPLESWNDFEPVKGLFSLAQPGIRRLWDTRNPLQILLKWVGSPDGAKDYRDVLKAHWEANILQGISWNMAVDQGVVDRRKSGTQPDFIKGSVKGASAGSAGDGLEVVVYESYNLRDGRHATNGWLQEMSDPMSRVSWTNVAYMSPATLKEQGFEEGEYVEVSADIDGRSATCTVPVMRQPGQADGTVAVSLGYGRTKAGKITHGRGVEEDAVDPELLDEGVYKIGGNAFPLIGAKPVSAKLSGTGRQIRLAKISKHDSQEGRPILKQTSFSEWKKNKSSGNQEHIPVKDVTLWPKWEYKGHKWGMVIDLNACTGCNACVVACNVENNIPVVGKEEVWRRREMHWIRVDAYYEDDNPGDGTLTTAVNPEVGFQPMMCQHCENAPCETVCPVIATSHTEEGLNAQAYNRCIGTRYCANNCPYKVRRFNWFRYEHHNLTMNLAINPDVVVRSRGVMEKCSMCAQRIYEGKRNAALHETEVNDGDITPACAQTCPTHAIVMGDQNDEDTRVAQLLKDPRNYAVLAEINTRPAVTYLTKVRNRAPKKSELAMETEGGHDGHGH
ncbi:MAG: 4Fe-4S dicluster domain-containing protein [Planctomycetes bacterium]|nr:4Fe-4S dicluster domain-containing protein [Planctomycetota bacterium]